MGKVVLMAFSISISFNGNCRQAVAFYAKVFEQDISSILTYGAGAASFLPDVQASPQMKSRIMSAPLCIAGTTVEFCDTPSAFGFNQGNNIFLTVCYEEPHEAKKIFDRLSEDGEIYIPFSKIQENYYGILEDKFNLCWIVKA